ncbi:hypothetical protein [Acetonema longum]|uniref:Outer membrane protein beta-barrel domain-containing protein n=1 Tax=Acetonema longum DSM 6540 TaxID=1009370 RepID=F7NI93_9FIRM|nr:hypothetical protein [Acetonema longum]EGO64241.1 hypothetical protein ALO_08957 [Acetonema longum DSM 6540]
MQKAALIGIVSTTLIAVPVSAAPITELNQGESAIGYMYQNPSFKIDSRDFGTMDTHGFYLESKVGRNLIVGLEKNDGRVNWRSGAETLQHDNTYTDVYLQSKVGGNVRLILGNRFYDGSSLDYNLSSVSSSETNSGSKVYVGVAVNDRLGSDVDGYMAFTASSSFTEVRLGANYHLSKTTFINLNIKAYNDDSMNTSLELDGVGMGLTYKF